MTSPGRYRNEPADIVEALDRLEKRVKVLEANPQIGSTTIDTGTLRVKDNTGSIRVQVGLLSDSSYGIEAKETGQDNFHQVPYVFANTVAAFQGTTSTSYTDLATPGPAVTVPVRSTGRVLVMIFTQIQWAANVASPGPITQGGLASVAVSGANTIAATVVDDQLMAMDFWIWALGGGIGFTNSATKSPASATVFEGLNPGDTTFTMKYAQISGAANAAEFGRRTIAVVAL